MSYADAFELTSEQKQVLNATGQTVVGDAPQGTADQNADIIAANQEPGEWDSAPEQPPDDNNDAIAEANTEPEFAYGEVSYDAVTGVNVVLPPNQVLVMDGDDVPVVDQAGDTPPGSPADATVADGHFLNVRLTV